MPETQPDSPIDRATDPPTGSARTGQDAPKQPRAWLRVAAAGAIAISTLTYVFWVLIAKVPPERRLGAVEVAMLLGALAAAAILLKPDLLQNVKSFKTSWFELEVHEKLQRQSREIDNVRFMLSLLIPKHELAHLENLRRADRVAYNGTAATLGEFRRLRDFGLIEMHPGQTIGSLLNRKFDPQQVITLTERGRYLLQRLDEQNKDVEPKAE